MTKRREPELNSRTECSHFALSIAVFDGWVSALISWDVDLTIGEFARISAPGAWKTWVAFVASLHATSFGLSATCTCLQTLGGICLGDLSWFCFGSGDF